MTNIFSQGEVSSRDLLCNIVPIDSNILLKLKNIYVERIELMLNVLTTEEGCARKLRR